jgi:membrane-associated phospholipid phosphatase
MPVLRELDSLDQAVFAAIAATPTPSLDVPLRRLSNAANYSRLWLAIAASLALFGGHRGRRAAVSGAAAVGATAAVVNLVQRVVRRRRPDRERFGVPAARRVRVPSTASFPSGHSASGLAFATAVGVELPVLALPLRVLALAVAYSRVHAGVHYPSDAIVGGMMGGGMGQMVAARLRRRHGVEIG